MFLFYTVHSTQSWAQYKYLTYLQYSIALTLQNTTYIAIFKTLVIGFVKWLIFKRISRNFCCRYCGLFVIVLLCAIHLKCSKAQCVQSECKKLMVRSWTLHCHTLHRQQQDTPHTMHEYNTTIYNCAVFQIAVICSHIKLINIASYLVVGLFILLLIVIRHILYVIPTTLRSV